VFLGTSLLALSSAHEVKHPELLPDSNPSSSCHPELSYSNSI
jgi:hypothetical protein